MYKKSPQTIIVAGVVVFLLIAGGYILKPQTAKAVSVSPVRLEITGDPGTTVHSEFVVTNDEAGEKTFYSTFENFEAQGETGTPNFIPAKDGLATWITAPGSITLKPGEKQTVPFSITIPSNAEAGGNFAAIFLGTTPPEKQGQVQVAIGGRIGILVLLKVSGPVSEKGGLLEFFAEGKKSIFSSEPVNLYYRFQNNGGDRIKPTGSVVVRNMFGLTSATLSANPSEGNILPDSIRKFNVVWGQALPESAHQGFWSQVGRELQHFHFGRYTANIVLSYGATNQTVSQTLVLWLIPWQLLSLILILAVAAYFIFGTGLKRYNRWIIKRAKVAARSR
jgi:hypothetical protein